MDEPLPALHQAILGLDVEGFGAGRLHPDQLAVRAGMYGCLRTALEGSGISWDACYHEDRGDGVLVLVPAQIPKAYLVVPFLRDFSTAVRLHNEECEAGARMRIRLVLHGGEVLRDPYGVAGTAINVAFRMLEAATLKQELATSRGVLAVITSPWFFDEVIRNIPASDPASYRQVLVQVKETDTVAWVCRPDDPYPRADSGRLRTPPQAALVRQLPAGLSGFTGRELQLEALTRVLGQSSAKMAIAVIEGTAGIGKSTLAVTWAHRAANRFPDGQLYVNLRGFDPAGAPLPPAEAILRFLDALQVPAERIPVSLDARAALYRSLLAGRRVLVVLDNARDAEQVRPLLPGSPGCAAVVTSRNQLTSLMTAEGACLIPLDLPSEAEASELLAGRIGAARVAAEPQAVAEIVSSCARLPLALAIVAARAAAHPAFPLAALASKLDEARGNLSAFGGADVTADPRAVFSWSYRQLTPETARLFRVLGLHPGPDITVQAAASLAGVCLTRVQPMLDQLSQAYLIAEHVPGRFALHDLLRAYAAELAQAHDSPAEQEAAVRRLLGHYLGTAHAAALLLGPRFDLISVASAPPAARPQELRGYAAAWAWFEAEYPVLLQTVRLAADTGHLAHAWQLPAMMAEFLDRSGRWHQWISACRTALAAAERDTSRYALAHAHLGLGRACHWRGRKDEDQAHFRQALDLFTEIGDRAGQACAHVELAHIAEHQGRMEQALSHAQLAADCARAAGTVRTQGQALNNIGCYQARLAAPDQAVTSCTAALALHRQIADRRGESRALEGLGYAHHASSRYQQAIDCYRQAIAIRQDLGYLYGQAHTLTYLGDSQQAAGNPAAAGSSWEQALDILEQLGHTTRAGQVRTKLTSLKTCCPGEGIPG